MTTRPNPHAACVAAGAPCGMECEETGRRIDAAARDAEPFYTPAAGDADQYNEWGQPRGYVHPSAG